MTTTSDGTARTQPETGTSTRSPEAHPETQAIFSEPGKDLTAQTKLAKSLKPRHLTMIALGGIIGAGFLVGSGTAIQAAGPAALLAYAFGGLVIVLVMRMLGEMASSSPDTGSFSSYANRFIGPWAGMSIGWLYWWFWTVVVGIEATAAAQLINSWVPAVPQWALALAITAVFLAFNLASVKSFGETEFWFSSIKVGAIIAFIVVGLLLIFQVIPNGTASLGNLAPVDGGFMPHGIGGVLSAFLPVVFGMFGAEVATIAAGESENPKAAVWVAVKSVVWRVVLFYIGSISIVLIVLPWTSITPGLSPFVTMLNVAGVEWAGLAMSIIVLSAILSTLNASLYTASRMAFSLAGRGEAPRALRGVTKRGTPAAAILASAVVGLLCAVLNYTTPEYVFSFLVNSISAIAIFVWIIIAVSQLRSRKILGAPQPGSIRMWGHPWLGVGLVAVLVFLLAYVCTTGPKALVEMLTSCIVAAICVVAGLVLQRRQRREADAATTARVPAEAGKSRSSNASDLV